MRWVTSGTPVYTSLLGDVHMQLEPQSWWRLSFSLQILRVLWYLRLCCSYDDLSSDVEVGPGDSVPIES